MMSSQQYPSIFSNASFTAFENLHGCAVDKDIVYNPVSSDCVAISFFAAWTPTAV
jgi:hypothetical protein